jgi:hypothetical protein
MHIFAPESFGDQGADFVHAISRGKQCVANCAGFFCAIENEKRKSYCMDFCRLGQYFMLR